MKRISSSWTDLASLFRSLGTGPLALLLAWIALAGASLSLSAWFAPLALGLTALTLGRLAHLKRRMLRAEIATSEMRANQQALVERHVIDEISGVMTRRGFLEVAAERIRQRGHGESLAFLALDMDHLKTLNDSFGHRAGDFALAHIAQTVQHVAPTATIGRLGGDEFAFMVPCPDEATALDLGHRFSLALNRPVMAGGRRMTLSASLGVVMIPERTDYLTEAMQFADIALYAAKAQGRNLTVVFDADMLSDLKRRRLIERELRAAILLNELDLQYQPIIGANGRLIAVEALLRWQSPSRGNISPALFIPIAESTALIDRLGEWVLRRAVEDARDMPGVTISVNVSANQLKRDDVVEMVGRVLQESGHPAAHLILELTESAAVQTTPDICRRLQALRDMGIRISLDDFGTGFSGFDYLRHLPVDAIKIDRSYIAKLGESETDNVLVSALASVAGAMRLSVVAEGIETEKQLLLARAAGCTQFQGYHLARPMPKQDLIRNHGADLTKYG